MTLEELLLQKLAEWRFDSGPRTLTVVPHPESGVTASVQAECSDRVGCQVRELNLTRSEAVPACRPENARPTDGRPGDRPPRTVAAHRSGRRARNRPAPQRRPAEARRRRVLLRGGAEERRRRPPPLPGLDQGRNAATDRLPAHPRIAGQARRRPRRRRLNQSVPNDEAPARGIRIPLAGALHFREARSPQDRITGRGCRCWSRRGCRITVVDDRGLTSPGYRRRRRSPWPALPPAPFLPPSAWLS